MVEDRRRPGEFPPDECAGGGAGHAGRVRVSGEFVIAILAVDGDLERMLK
ncbi:hypothetical protein J31TS4_37030 [Paenibacillus sp. J31TS4]|nr:hypothetical protein J31TS4_37030 [Paenibacillus sp. J31TS4]